MKVKMFYEDSPYKLEKTINEFLNQHKNMSIVDIKYSAWGKSYYSEYTAMIIIKGD